MAEIIRIGVIVLMLLYTIKLKKFKLVYLALLFFTSFFNFINSDKLGIPGILNNYNIGFIFLIIEFIMIKKNPYLTFNENRKLISISHIFILICIISFINTVFISGYFFVSSLKVAFYFFSIIGLILYLKIFENSKKTDFDQLLRPLEIFTIINAFGYIIYVFFDIKIVAFGTDYGPEMIGNIKRVVLGLPHLLPFFLAFNYIKIRTMFKVRRLLIILLYSLIVFLTFTRGYTLAIFSIIVVIELTIDTKHRIKNIFKSLAVFSFLILCIVLVFPKYVDAFWSRFSEVSTAQTIEDVQNASFRFGAAMERIQYAAENNFMIGTGFINNYDNNISFGFIFYDQYIHGDIFYPNVFLTTGILGSVIYLILLFYLYKNLKLRTKNNVLALSSIAFYFYALIHCFTSNYLYYNFLIFAFIMSVGITYDNHNSKKISS